MEPATFLFDGRRIEYGDCAGEDTQEEITYTLDRANNDIGYCQSFPDEVADDGFVFANTYTSGANYYFIQEYSLYNTSELLSNGHMALPNLVGHYHLWRRPLPTGTLNNSLTTFESSIPRKKQTEIRVIYSRASYRDWDPSTLVKTQMGWGEVESAEYSARTCTLTLKLRHE